MVCKSKKKLINHCKIFLFLCLQDVFAKHAALFKELHVNANNGLGDVYDKIKVRHKPGV